MLDFRIVNTIKDTRYPHSSTKYLVARMQTGKIMRKKHGNKLINDMDKNIQKIPPGEFAGKISKTGKIKVSSKVAPRYRGLVAEWETVLLKQVSTKR